MIVAQSKSSSPAAVLALSQKLEGGKVQVLHCRKCKVCPHHRDDDGTDVSCVAEERDHGEVHRCGVNSTIRVTVPMLLTDCTLAGLGPHWNPWRQAAPWCVHSAHAGGA